jgi:hypothetical protein
MRVRVLLVFSALLAVLALGCGNNGIGDVCDLAQDCNVNNPPDNANTLCEPAPSCETLLCVGQGQGLGTGVVDPFCTAACNLENNKPCPEGFTCAIATEVGAFANKPFCLKNVE